MGRINKYSKKLTRYEQQANKQKRIATATCGNGRYIYKNRLPATLQLPKPGLDGKKVVGPNEEWEGDDYFMFMVNKTREAFLVREIIEEPKEQPIQETKMPEEKLILDQPERVTTEGTVERIVTKPSAKPLHEANPGKAPVSMPKDVLINEDPSSGVEILLG